jgi:glycosyltransferase involved in cell wall biosynthesis
MARAPAETRNSTPVLRGPIGVMHVIDTLHIGGAERVAVNLANLLPRDRFRSYLCSTRAGGPLAVNVAPHVDYWMLQRRSRFDVSAAMQFARFIREHKIRIVHAHASSLFFCRLAGTVFHQNGASLIWHDHYGRCDLNDRPVWLYRLATRQIAGAIAVNQKLVDWCLADLRISPEKVWYIPNLVEERKPPQATSTSRLQLPGIPGKRLVCVANLRPQKDHPTLLRAMSLLNAAGSEAHLILVGDSAEPEYFRQIRSLIAALRLERSVTYLGPRLDVADVLSACDIGVLSSASEGLPLALLEYGQAGLPAVSTAVGQCPEVLLGGKFGLLVPPQSPGALSEAILRLLGDPRLRHTLGGSFQRHVAKCYSAAVIMAQICQVYDKVLRRSA